MESSFAKTELLICWPGEALADCSLPDPSNRSLWWSKRWACGDVSLLLGTWAHHYHFHSLMLQRHSSRVTQQGCDCFYFREGSDFLRTNVPLSTQVYEVTRFSHFWPDLRELGWGFILASVDFLFFPLNLIMKIVTCTKMLKAFIYQSPWFYHNVLILLTWIFTYLSKVRKASILFWGFANRFNDFKVKVF